MFERIPQSATKRVVFKAFLSSDHVSAATGKTIAVKVSKNAAAFADPSAGATNATEIASGWYYVDLSTTDTGTLGPLIVRGTEATIDPAEVVFSVVDANTGGLGNLDAAVSTRLATSGYTAPDTAATIAGAVWDESRASHTTTGTFGGDAVDSADLVDSIWDEAQSGHTTAGTFGKYLDSAISGVSTGGVTAADIADAVLDEALSGHTTAGTLGKAVSDILDDTGTSGVIVDTNNDKTGYSLATAPLDAAGVRSAIGLASANLDTQLGDIPTATENADALLKRDMSAVSGESSRSPLNALRALRNKVSVSGTTLTVTKEDDSTSAWTATVTTDETATPITAVDPA